MSKPEVVEAQLAAYFVYFGYLVFGFVLPPALFVRMQRSRWVQRIFTNAWGIALVVAYITWFIQIVFRIWTSSIVSHYRTLVLNSQSIDGDFRLADGVGGNLLLLMLGWIPPMLALLAARYVPRIRQWCDQ